jgi:hypothetical protein
VGTAVRAAKRGCKWALFANTFFSTFVAHCTYEEGKLSEVLIYSVDLGVGKNRTWSRMSVARTPSPELALDILTKIQQFSEPFGTQISIENGVGVIRVPPEATVPVGAGIREKLGQN